MEWAFLAGRVIFGLFFVINGVNHFAMWRAMSGYAASKGVPAPQAAVIITGLLSLDRAVACMPYAVLVQPYDALKLGQQTAKIRNGFLLRLTRAGNENLAVVLALIRSRCWSNCER
jgi:hypothetical protein